MILSLLTDVLKESLEVTLLVLAMMSLIEVFNVWTEGRMLRGLRGSGPLQIVVSALLGSIPGCAGGFASVSLYNHRMISFGALVAMMVATTGDEAFLMLALFPKQAAGLFAILLGLGIAIGFLTDRFRLGKGLRDIPCTEDDHPEATEKEPFSWKRVREFLRENIWHHVIRKHLPALFAWTFGVMLVFGLLDHYFDLERWISGTTPLMILLATAIGFIPQSGPHIAFVSLFASGVIPFPVLLANSISQDGHASLPLLSESKSAFLRAKTIKAAIAILLPLLLYGL